MPVFLQNNKVVLRTEHQVEKRADRTVKLEIFRVIVAMELAGSTDLVRPRSVAPDTENIASQKRLLRFFAKALPE